jgi:hypothetical protein
MLNKLIFRNSKQHHSAYLVGDIQLHGHKCLPLEDYSNHSKATSHTDSDRKTISIYSHLQRIYPYLHKRKHDY